MPLFKLVTTSSRTETKTEITRWMAKGEIGPHMWDELICRLQKLFHTTSTQFFLSWFDGTDYCTVRDVADLQEAVEYFNEEGSGDKAVRLFVSPDNQKHQTIFGEMPDDSDTFTVVDEPVTEIEPEVEEAPLGSTPLVTIENTTEQPKAELSDSTRANEEVSELEKCLESSLNTEQQAECSEKVQVSATPAMNPNVFSNTPPQPTYQLPSYTPYAGLYPYGHCYPGNSFYPAPFPRWPMLSNPLQTFPTNVPPSLDASAPPVTDATLETKAAVSKETICAITVKPPSAPIVSKPHGAKVQKQSCKREATPGACKTKEKTKYVGVALKILREMGFQQEEKELKRVIRSCNGNLNEIMDRLQCSSS
ncbi:unnamed protein product [Dicrocoelium dendriticum]|nr:unnamed protein product [Dicrocoelium dendriticum]